MNTIIIIHNSVIRIHHTCISKKLLEIYNVKQKFIQKNKPRHRTIYKNLIDRSLSYNNLPKNIPTTNTINPAKHNL